MRLLFLHNRPLEFGKANTIQVLQMCHAFAELGQEVTLGVASRGGIRSEDLARQATAQLGKSLEFRFVTYRKLTVAGRSTVIGGCLGASRLLSRMNVDFCLTRNPLYVHCAVRQGVPTLIEAHNSIFHDSRWLNHLVRANLLRNCRRVELVGFVAISQNLADFWVKEGVPKEKTLVLHDGVDIDEFQDVPDVKTLRRRLGLPADRKIVVYAGSFYPDREIENILKLAQSERNAFFVLVGGPDMNVSRFVAQASRQRIRNIAFTGHVPHTHVKDYLFAADVLLMVWSKKVRTINYCSPLKVFEYMAAGKTIVGHGFRTICEGLTDGENALLAEPESFDELRSKLRQAIEMPTNNKMAQAARKIAFEKYSWKDRARRILAHIGDLRETDSKQ